MSSNQAPNSRGCYRSYQSLLKKYSTNNNNNNDKPKETLKIDEGVRQTIEKITAEHRQASAIVGNSNVVDKLPPPPTTTRIEEQLDKIIERMNIDDVVQQLDMLDSESLRQFLILLKRDYQKKNVDEVKVNDDGDGSDSAQLDKNNNREANSDEHNKQNLIASIKAFLQANVLQQQH